MRLRFYAGFLFALLFITSSQIFANELDYDLLAKASTTSTQRTDQTCFKIQQSINSAFYLGFGGSIGTPLSTEERSVNKTEEANLQITTTQTFKQVMPAVGFIGIVGYKLNQMVALEVFYYQNAWKQKERSSVTTGANLLNLDDANTLRTTTIHFGPRALLTLPINKYCSPYVMAGLMAVYIHTGDQQNDSGGGVAPDVASTSVNTWALTYGQGFGIRSQITENIALRLERRC